MRLVLAEEARLVDSMAMTMSQRIAAIHALRRFFLSEFKRAGQRYSMA